MINIQFSKSASQYTNIINEISNYIEKLGPSQQDKYQRMYEDVKDFNISKFKPIIYILQCMKKSECPEEANIHFSNVKMIVFKRMFVF